MQSNVHGNTIVLRMRESFICITEMKWNVMVTDFMIIEFLMSLREQASRKT